MSADSDAFDRNAAPVECSGSSRRDWLELAAIIVAFVIAVACVNPFRETPIDDDWAYAETVRHFLNTGQYRLNDWLSANMPFQTLWASLFCGFGGYSFGVLRLSTLVLAVVALVAFRVLATEHRIRPPSANLLVFCIASSPMFFRLSHTFMTDVPFVATMLVALVFYTRALRLMKWTTWLAASVAGACAILTRQFGIALVAALAVEWFFDRRRLACAGQYLLGILLPAAAFVWQLDQGWNHSNWAALHVLNRQAAYVRGPRFIENIPWRLLIVLEYAAWLLIPLVVIALVAAIDGRRQTRTATGDQRNARSSARDSARVWLALLVACVVGDFYGHWLLDTPLLMPFVPWNFEILNLFGVPIRLAVTVFTLIGAVLFGEIVARRYRDSGPQVGPLSQYFLDLTTLFSLGLTLLFFVLGDEYLLVYLPFAAIVVGRRLEPWLISKRRLIVAMCCGLLVGSAVWTREGLCRQQAIWTLAERLHGSGVPTGQISAGWEWLCAYHFDDYVREVPPTAHVSFADIFARWVPEQRERAEFLIVHDLRPPAGERWIKVDKFQYFSVFSRGTETFYAVRREREGGISAVPRTSHLDSVDFASENLQ